MRRTFNQYHLSSEFGDVVINLDEREDLALLAHFHLEPDVLDSDPRHLLHVEPLRPGTEVDHGLLRHPGLSDPGLLALLQLRHDEALYVPIVIYRLILFLKLSSSDLMM